MKKLSMKRLDRMIDETYRKHGQNVEINVMDIPKLYKDVHADYETALVAPGATDTTVTAAVDASVKTAIAKYRRN